MANVYDKRSENHAGYNEGTKVETTVDHHEVNRDLSSGKILTVVSIAHYPTRVIAVDENGEEVARDNAELLGCRTIDSLLDVAKKAFS